MLLVHASVRMASKNSYWSCIGRHLESRLQAFALASQARDALNGTPTGDFVGDVLVSATFFVVRSFQFRLQAFPTAAD